MSSNTAQPSGSIALAANEDLAVVSRTSFAAIGAKELGRPRICLFLATDAPNDSFRSTPAQTGGCGGGLSVSFLYVCPEMVGLKVVCPEVEDQ